EPVEKPLGEALAVLCAPAIVEVQDGRGGQGHARRAAQAGQQLEPDRPARAAQPEQPPEQEHCPEKGPPGLPAAAFRPGEQQGVSRRQQTPIAGQDDGEQSQPGLRQTPQQAGADLLPRLDRKSTRLNSSHVSISYAVSCLKK